MLSRFVEATIWRTFRPWLLVQLVVFALPPITVAGEPPAPIVIPALEKSAAEPARFFPALLELALSKTEGADQLPGVTEYPQVLTPARVLSKLQQDDELQVIWSLSAPELEQTLIKVPVPLLRGLNGYRVLLIREQDRDKFAAVKTLADLAQWRGGMVSHWLDTAYLQAHGLPLFTPAHYELLFDLLETGRVDYLPRGVHEVWDEQALHAGKGLVVEPTLLLHYPAPYYFFLHPSNGALAQRIEKGLQQAMADGSYEALFFSIPGLAKGYQLVQANQRHLLRLAPHIAAKTIAGQEE